MGTNDHLIPLLRLSLTNGVGPVMARRLLAEFGSAAEVFKRSPAELQRVRGIGEARANEIARGLEESVRLAEDELALAERRGVDLIPLGDPRYPPLLGATRDAPIMLYVRGALPPPEESYSVAIVGSRRATAYGIEQTERFSVMLAQSGLAIVSGGARGIDTAAHRAALRAQGRTIVVLGCGLARCYPPENADLFDRIVELGGAIISELPLSTTPAPENFPARNRIISAISLGVIVVEAPIGSGALITARCAIDEHNREVMAIPGRVDSKSSEGTNDLIRRGEAALVTHPSEVIELLEAPARHQFMGTHDQRFATEPLPRRYPSPLWESEISGKRETSPVAPISLDGLDEGQRQIVETLAQPMSIDQLARATGRPAAMLQADLTMLEIRRVVVREGSLLAVRTGPDARK